MKRKILSALLIVIIISLPISVFAYVNSDTGLKFNKSGKSYGTVYDAITVPDEPLSVNEPDLIYVLATNGKYGYSKKEDMYACGPTSPDDTEWEKRIFGNKDYYEIDVFDSDGVTKRGKFRINK